jgi:carboxypeptidase family protein
LPWLALAVSLTGCPLSAQPQQSRAPATVELPAPDPPQTQACGVDQHTDAQQPGSITGIVVDPTGNGVAGAHITLAREDRSPALEQLSRDDGQFSFSNVAPGPFHLSIDSSDFAPQSVSGNLSSGESCVVPRMTLAVATNVTEVRVELSTVEIAQDQITEQEKQRLFGVIPNFYVSYVPDAVPLTSRQKFQLAWKSTVDPVSFGVTGVVAGVQQATDKFPGYGQGAAGYGRRYGAAYGDLVTGTYIGGAVLPSLLKQDPRYFYKGTGSVKSRVLYALANSVICKGDNGRWQPNYSGILGSLASGGISNLYYPDGDKNDAALTFENALIGIGETAAVNLLQEFVMRRLTPNLPKSEPASTTTP